jgi:hypothetical protein
MTIEGQKLHTLCDQDLMLVLYVHAAKHAWRQISWLSDIAHLARSRAMDWVALRAEAERLGIVRIVTLTFLLAHKLLGAEFPAQFGAQFREERDAIAEGLTQRIVNLIVADDEFDPETIAYFRLMTEFASVAGTVLLSGGGS